MTRAARSKPLETTRAARAPRRRLSALWPVVVAAALLTLATAAWAAPPPLSLELTLTAHGGVSAKAPAWKVVRDDAAVAVLEQLPDPAQREAFHVLMLAVEDGIPEDDVVPWETIRDNIVDAASEDARALTLELGDAFGGAAGFEGRVMSGTFRGAAEQQVGLEVVALVRAGRLVTVSLVSDAVSSETRELVEAVAATVAAGE